MLDEALALRRPMCRWSRSCDTNALVLSSYSRVALARVWGLIVSPQRQRSWRPRTSSSQTGRREVDCNKPALIYAHSPWPIPRSPLSVNCSRDAFVSKRKITLSSRDAKDHEAERLAIESLDQLVTDFPDRLEYQFDLMETLAEFSVFNDSLDVVEDPIRQRLQRAIEIGESLVTLRPDVTLYTSALVHAHYKLAVLERRTAERAGDERRPQRWAAAARHFREAVSRQSELIRRFPAATGYAAWQALFRQQLADVSLKMGDLEEAQYQVTAAIFLIEDLMQVSGNRLLDALADRAYATLDAIFWAEGTPRDVLPTRF